MDVINMHENAYLFIVYLIVLRGLALVISGALVILGYKLYNDNVKPITSAEFEASGFRFKATKLGPGVVFAIAGAIGVWRSFEIPAEFDVFGDVDQRSRVAEPAPPSDLRGTIRISGASGDGSMEFARIRLGDLAVMSENALPAGEDASLEDVVTRLAAINAVVTRVVFDAVGEHAGRIRELRSRDRGELTSDEQGFLDRYGPFFPPI